MAVTRKLLDMALLRVRLRVVNHSYMLCDGVE